MIDYTPFFLFYGCVGLLLWAVFSVALRGVASSSRRVSIGLILAFCVVLVSSEWWEVPFFMLGYLGVDGFGVPHVLNHVLVAGIALVLFSLSNFRFDGVNFVVLACDLELNFLFLLVFPNLVSGWILRSISLTCLTYCVARSLKP